MKKRQEGERKDFGRDRYPDGGHENRIEGRHSVLEAFRAGRVIERVYVLKGCQDGPVLNILREAKRCGTLVDFVPGARLDYMSGTGKHQGVVAQLSAFAYSTMEDVFARAGERDEDPFVFLLDGIEDPHNLGAIIRTANMAGAHGVIIPKRRAVGLTATVVKASAGAVHYTPVVKVTNLTSTMEQLKERGMWFACADMNGEAMYRLNLKGALGLVIGNEGNGVSRLVREHCDYAAAIPTCGDIDSLNASVAAGVLAFEVVRQRSFS